MSIVKLLFVGLIVLSISACKLSGTVEGWNLQSGPQGSEIDPGDLLITDVYSGETLPISIEENGEFEFTTDYRFGSRYSLQVYPDNPSVLTNCWITKGSGVFAWSNVSDVSIKCGPIIVECPTEEDAEVCGAEYKQGVDCIQPLCSLVTALRFKTFTSQCEANGSSSSVIFEGDCGENEDSIIPIGEIEN